MNQTVIGAITPVESAFSFIKDQVDRYAHAKQELNKRQRQMLRQAMTVGTAAVLTVVTALPVPTIGADEATLNQPAFESSITFDKSYSLLAIEDSAIEIKPGASHEQERLAAEARKRAAQAAKTVVSTPSTRTVTVKVSADEAHRIAQEAAAKAGIPSYWKELAAIWQVESGKAMQSCVVSSADGRAVGPMQFMPGTFRSYAADGDGDGRADICNAKDALVAAANLLKRGGIAEGNVDGAIHNYNHSMAYVRKVKQIANSIN